MLTIILKRSLFLWLRKYLVLLSFARVPFLLVSKFRYGKCPKILVFVFMQLFLKILGGMANIADPDLKEQSDLGVHCLHMRFCQKLWCEKKTKKTKKKKMHLHTRN